MEFVKRNTNKKNVSRDMMKVYMVREAMDQQIQDFFFNFY